MSEKRGLGLIQLAGKAMPWGKGAAAGDFIFLSGVDARQDDTDTTPVGIGAQTELVLERIKRYLAEAGASIENTVKFVFYLSDRAMEQEFWEVRDKWFEKNAPSLLNERSYAGTLLIVGLARYDMLVEIDCVAYVPPKK